MSQLGGAGGECRDFDTWKYSIMDINMPLSSDTAPTTLATCSSTMKKKESRSKACWDSPRITAHS